MMDDFRWPIAALPRLILAGRIRHADRDHGVVYRNAAFHALHLFEYGGERAVDGRVHAFAAGDLAFSPAGGDTTYHLPRPGFHLCIHFAPEPSESGPALALPLHLPLGATSAHLAERLRHIIGFSNRGGPAACAAASAGMLAILCELALAGHNAGANAAALERIAARIGEDCTRNDSVGELAKWARLSPVQLRRGFRRHFGVTVQRYRQLRRVEAARVLLQTTMVPVGGIAAAVGVPDAQHFNKLFRRLVGTSPSGVRAGR